MLHDEEFCDFVRTVKLEGYDVWAGHRPTWKKRGMHA
jgi:hypothetical protein